MKKQSLFDAIGGIEVMEHVHTVFYDKVYAHPWLGQGNRIKISPRRQSLNDNIFI